MAGQDGPVTVTIAELEISKSRMFETSDYVSLVGLEIADRQIRSDNLG